MDKTQKELLLKGYRDSIALNKDNVLNEVAEELKKEKTKTLKGFDAYKKESDIRIKAKMELIEPQIAENTLGSSLKEFERKSRAKRTLRITQEKKTDGPSID